MTVTICYHKAYHFDSVSRCGSVERNYRAKRCSLRLPHCNKSWKPTNCQQHHRGRFTKTFRDVTPNFAFNRHVSLKLIQLEHATSRVSPLTHWVRHFKRISLYEDYCILVQISINLDPNGSINHWPALAYMMDRHHIGDKPLYEQMMTYTDVYMHLPAVMS